MIHMPEPNSVEKMLKTAFNDPISNILLNNSNLTKIQFETYVIDILIDNVTEKELTYDKKKIFRSKKVSRGAFSRTLSQGRRNIISSIFTILLLNYIGIIEGSPLEEFQALSNNLREYSNSVRGSDSVKSRDHLKNFERELFRGIENLARPQSLRSV